MKKIKVQTVEPSSMFYTYVLVAPQILPMMVNPKNSVNPA